MSINPCCCGGCIVCFTDNFDRDDYIDIMRNAPLKWLAPQTGQMEVKNKQCDIGVDGSFALLDQEVNLELLVEYWAEVEYVSMDTLASAVLVTSFADYAHYYAAVFQNDGGGTDWTITLLWVSPAGQGILNQISVSIAAKKFRLTLNIETNLIEATILDINDNEENCVGPYEYNYGSKVGFGCDVAGTTANMKLDNFRLCENRCSKGCIYFTDEFARANSFSLGDNWKEYENIESDVGIFNEEILFYNTGAPTTAINGNGSIYCKTPHPDGHTTMGVAVRARMPTVMTGNFPNPIGTLKIRVCVDDWNDPKSYVEVEWDCGRQQLRIWGVHKGARTLLDLTQPAQTGFIEPNEYYDYYVCVSDLGQIRAYVKHAGTNTTGINWTPQAETIQYPQYLTGTYFGMWGQGDDRHKTMVTSVQALKSYHPGKPELWKFIVCEGVDPLAKPIEIGDKFIVGVTVAGVPETYTVAALTTDRNEVAMQIRNALNQLDIQLYPNIRSIKWLPPPIDALNTFTGEIQGKVTCTAATLEANDDPSDAQTFTTSKTQEWEKGAYDCPRCPPICDPCSYCKGPDPRPEIHNEPQQINIVMEGVEIFGGVPSHDAGDGCAGWNAFNAVKNTYGPPWPGFPANYQCFWASDFCLGYNGSFLLEPCGCRYLFHWPEWFEYYYFWPDLPIPPGGGNPDNIGQFNPSDFDPVYFTCWPGEICNGFFITADIRREDFGPNVGLLFWNVRFHNQTITLQEYQSERFPDTECKLPRTLENIDPIWPNPNSECFWPFTIQLHIVK